MKRKDIRALDRKANDTDFQERAEADWNVRKSKQEEKQEERRRKRIRQEREYFSE